MLYLQGWRRGRGREFDRPIVEIIISGERGIPLPGTLPVSAYVRLLGCVVRRAPSRRLGRVFRVVSIAEAAARPLDELSPLKEYVGRKEFRGHGHTEAL
jgi:hypothetical protein